MVSASLFSAIHGHELLLLTLLLLSLLLTTNAIPRSVKIISVVMAVIAHQFGDFIHRSYITLDRDLRGLALLIRVKMDLNRRLKENRGIHEIFLDVVRRHPDKTCMIDIATERSLSFVDFNKMCNRFANYFQSAGYREGDVIALFMENCVEFVAAWMGLAKIGVTTAWINSNLKLEPLAHCLHISKAKSIICSEMLSSVLKESADQGLLKDLELRKYVYGRVPADSMINLKAELDCQDADAVTCEPRPPVGVDFKSVLCFIYTSGTTGMPKAALMKHFRYYSMVMGSAESFGILSTDRIYVSMPLYHTSAGILGVGQTLLRGSTCAVRQKFSASNFWRDCVKYDCTVSQYIGEICRYLLAQPVHEAEAQHRVRLMYGNGLRAEIWQEFIDRFHVKIGELYGSTEGTSNLVNIDGRIGSCGFLPISPLTARVHPIRLVRVDETTGEVVRRNDGLCYPCRPGETGAMVSTIRKGNPLLVFEGYLNESETSKKVIRDVFRRGDSCFLTGDILHWDRLGYVYFRDRTGDTFRYSRYSATVVERPESTLRWKGENVSTTEVEAVLMPLKSLVDVTVYGVQIPGMEGRAGMAAIVRSGTDDRGVNEFIDELAQRLTSSLPSYAIPVFIRLCHSVDRTGTFKLIKTNLQRLGYDNASSDEMNLMGSTDEIFIWEPTKRTYIPLDGERRRAVNAGEMGKSL